MLKMYRSTVCLAATALVGLTAWASPANAGSTTLGTSGWVASWPNSDNVVLSNVSVVGTTLHLTKTVTFNNNDAIPIVFQANGQGTPSLFVVVDSESVTNSTGTDWNGFRILVAGGGRGTIDDTQYDTFQTNVGAAGGFAIAPFTTSGYTDGSGITNNVPRVLNVSGGTVANGQIFAPGGGGHGLFIRTGADTVFTLKETPASSQTPPPPTIPLPTSFLAGIWSLGGLAMISGVRKARKIMS